MRSGVEEEKSVACCHLTGVGHDGACLTGCVPSTGWSTWDPSAITTTTDEPPIIRLRPSHHRCLLLCKRTAPKTALPHRNDAMSPSAMPASPQPTPDTAADATCPACVRTTTSPASIPLFLHLLLPESPSARAYLFAHFSALQSLHLLAREAAQASAVPARRAESFQSRGPPFRSSPLGPASASLDKAGKQASTALRKKRQCTPLPP